LQEPARPARHLPPQKGVAAHPDPRRRHGHHDPAPRAAEADYRGERFAAHPHDLKGNNDLLCLTRPDVIGGIHAAYLEAGADILETNTFNGDRVSQADYGWPSWPTNSTSPRAKLARGLRRSIRRRPSRASSPACSARPRAPPRSRPTSTTPARATSPSTSWSPTYLEAARGLTDGGVDILLVETVFDTLNAKAALFAIEKFFDEAGRRWPVMISGTITDASGRTLSGQTAEAFWNSLPHPPAVLRPQLRARRQGPAPVRRGTVALSDCLSRCIPTPACPTPSAATTRRPNMLAAESPTGRKTRLRQHRRRLLRHLARPHPPPSPSASKASAARQSPQVEKKLRLSGLEAFNVGAESLFVNVGERTNVTGSKAFARMILEGRYDDALAVARQQVENGAQVIDINMDEAMLDSKSQRWIAS
jgi:5-methyltetrahydrofolate--homocysteine methyltransferase